jgi:hypothetical protein
LQSLGINTTIKAENPPILVKKLSLICSVFTSFYSLDKILKTSRRLRE